MSWPVVVLIIFLTPSILIAIGVISSIRADKKRKSYFFDTDDLRDRLELAVKNENEKDLVILVVENWLNDQKEKGDRA